MIQILWRCEQCDDYGTIDLTDSRVAHLDPDYVPQLSHRLVIVNTHQPSRARWPSGDIVLADILKIENSGVQS